jgi:Protein of unknown function (DUF2934)
MAKRTGKAQGENTNGDEIQSKPTRTRPRRATVKASAANVESADITAEPVTAVVSGTGAVTDYAARDVAHDSATQGDVELSAGPTEDEIRFRAYQHYLERGGWHGADFDDWLQAERELRRR